MTTKIFTVKAAPPGSGPKTIQEALKLAEHTGVLEVPTGLQLNVNSGQPVEVKPHE